MGFHLGLGLSIQDPSPPKDHNGICRVNVESHEPPFMQNIDCHTMGFFNTTICLCVPQLFRDDDALGPCFPSRLPITLDTFAADLGPRGGYVFPR